jgi:DNA repair protein RadC
VQIGAIEAQKNGLACSQNRRGAAHDAPSSHLIDFVELFRGTLDGASVAPREVLKLVLARNAGAVILVHQHPSAVKDASRADELITATLRDALALIQVKVLDHIIAAGRDTLSFAESGLL